MLVEPRAEKREYDIIFSRFSSSPFLDSGEILLELDDFESNRFIELEVREKKLKNKFSGYFEGSA